jgi:lysophospholipase L1-like esterase
MGDSFSAGEGTFDYLPPVDPCHRSPLAYGPLLDADVLRASDPPAFVACSGAITSDLYQPSHGVTSEPPQLAALSESTRTVTLTIGGNDVGFAAVATACIRTDIGGGSFGCSKDRALTGAVASRIRALAGRTTATTLDGYAIRGITTILHDIHDRAPKARIYLAGYPELFGNRARDFTATAAAPSGYACQLNSLVNAAIDFDDAQWINRSTQRLNRVLHHATRRASRAGVPAQFVPLRTFDRHGLCDAESPWLNPVLIGAAGVLRESLHPTADGQQYGYFAALRRSVCRV